VNCFQTRKEFPNFWRRRLEPAQSDALAGHLERCGLCDQAYRLFALTAPVLYSDSEAVDAMLGSEERPRPARDRRSRAAGADATESRATVWTALSMLIAASVIAYVAAAAPSESLSDALSNSQASSAISAVQEPPSSFLDDFAG
jgi:hypothetical protein